MLVFLPVFEANFSNEASKINSTSRIKKTRNKRGRTNDEKKSMRGKITMESGTRNEKKRKKEGDDIFVKAFDV